MKKKNSTSVNNINLKNIFKWFWLIMVTGILCIAALFALISTSMLPDTEELENPQFEVASLVLDDPSDGKVEEIGRYFTHNRDGLTFEEINPHIVNALVATEDERFYEHTGIDFRGFARAAIYLGNKGGASTITQQLAKQFFTKVSGSFPKRVWQKLKEWVIATEFEKRYTKEEIIAMYLNKFDFLYNSSGISAASRTYFGKDQKDLEIDEAAVLVGMLNNPDSFNPKYRPERALKKRSMVMNQMVRNGFITTAEYQELKAKPLDMSGFMKAKNYNGPAPYFRAELTKWIQSLLEEEKHRKPDGSKYNIYTDGLQIFTTIDLPMQIHAEAAAKEHMSGLQNKYFNRWKNLDPWTYRADKEEKKTRQDNLNRHIEQSERYQTSKASILTPIIAKVKEQFPNFRLKGIDMVRMKREEKEPGYIASIVKKKWASKNQASTYKEVMRSAHWPTLKKAWNSFQNKITTDFKTPVQMKVFAYNEQGYKKVKMSPVDSIKYHIQHMQIGSLSLDPKNGFIKTWVGGINFDWYKYDHIQQSNNQIGSTFKPFIYTAAVMAGISPCQKIQDIQYTIPKGDPNFDVDKTWVPSNSKAFTGEYVTVKEGLKQSMNSVSVNLLKKIGNVETVRDLVEKFGIAKEKIPPYPSICLGTPDLTVMDMAGAYTVFANDGQYTKPMFVTKILDRDGRMIYSYKPEQRKVLSPEYNYVMVDMLKYVMQNHAYKYKSEVAGKTGTTNDHVDGWFIGFTPNLVTATWVGGSERWIRFTNLGDGAGSTMARPFFDKFLTRIENDKSIKFDVSTRFNRPEGDMIELDCSKYDLIAANFEKEEQAKKKNEMDEEFDQEF